MEANFS